ncbi:hypothetical protein GA0115240_14328 [Streptomyces sp. DvalAA-14]|uniref:DUF6479 family protein n=1 Tax=unclassified Streptomyces TaxID=2593676 RepID=UPI00081B58B0|nr:MULTISPECIES: DUF6479 family protein [unclassified Streptomyces]MYS22670.1 hypothetical protein [Streptomyces sp. SID4948]SCE20296.1 hypothetical protein GA0115240_14328 [Streptomyces sp. DvalAA-14]
MSAFAHPAVQLALQDYEVAIVPAILGVIIVIVLILAVRLGIKRHGRGPGVPRGLRPRSGAWQTRREHEVGAPEDHGPGHQPPDRRTHESRQPEPDEMPQDGRRRLPYEVRSSGVRGGRVRTRPKRHSGPNVD